MTAKRWKETAFILILTQLCSRYLKDNWSMYIYDI